jgi:hypothetical protein
MLLLSDVYALWLLGVLVCSLNRRWLSAVTWH